MNNHKASKLSLAFDPEDNIFASYNSSRDYFDKEIKNVFVNLSNMNKGIKFTESIDSSEHVLEISNKYYQTRVELNLLEINHGVTVSDETDALIIFWNTRNLRNFKVILLIKAIKTFRKFRN